MKKVSGKRGKTDSDLEQLAKLEFMGGLYLSDGMGVVLPADVVESTIINGAKKFKEGMQAKSGMYVPGHCKLIFDGPQEPEAMWADGRFTFQKVVSIGRNKIVRTRPKFDNWSAEVTVMYEDSVVNPDQVHKWFKRAGEIVGFCDWRPRYGRFSVSPLG